MDSEHKFWAIIAACCTIALSSFSGCTMHSNYVIGEMVKNGADPIQSYCAVGLNRDTMCNYNVILEKK